MSPTDSDMSVVGNVSEGKAPEPVPSPVATEKTLLKEI